MTASHAIRIVQAIEAPEYDLRGINIDLSRKTGVLIRQSKKGADIESRESRLRQEGLVPVAIELRREVDGSNIILYDEGSGVSGTKGYDQRPQLSRLYQDIANGVIGSIVVARADRLFRDKHFLNVGMFTQIAERQRIILIVPNRAVYDFTKTRDLQAFQREMQDAYSYIATQVQYMHDTRLQKIQRGFYGGGNLPAPYAIDKAMDKDQQVPIIYQPWHPLVIDLFQRFKDYDFVLARIARYIDEQAYIFPYPSAEDLHKYMFKTLMRRAGGGYTFSSGDSIRKYLSNLTLGGYAKIGRDSEGNTLFREGAFEAALPMELLGPAYAAITGYYPDGKPFDRKRYAMRSHTSSPGMESPAVLHGLLDSDDGMTFYHGANRTVRPFYGCNRNMEGENGRTLRGKMGIIQAERIWSVSCEELDHIVIKRLCELAQYDGDMSDRFEAFWNQRTSAKINEVQVLSEQIERADAQIRRLDKLLTDPASPLSDDAERRYIEALHEAEADRERLLKKQREQDHQRNPVDVIPTFYHVLSHLPVEYKRLTPEGQKRMARQVIQDIRLNMISTHLFLLRITWQTGIAVCPDVALVWRGKGARIGYDWTPEEDAVITSLYPSQPQAVIMQALPRRAWQSIHEHASKLGITRERKSSGRGSQIYNNTMSWDDVDAVSRLSGDPHVQNRLRQIANDLATQTVRGGLSVHWLLPLEAVSYTGASSGSATRDPMVFNVSPAHEARH